MNKEEKSKGEDVGLPKCNFFFKFIATITSFVKGVLEEKKIKCEKQIFDIIDRIILKYFFFYLIVK